jgi:hypothetical protein
MKKLYIYSFLTLAFISCKEADNPVLPNNKPIKNVSSLDYFIIPESENKIVLALESNYSYSTGRVTLDVKPDSTLATFERINIDGYLYTAAQITYPFSDKPINLQVQFQLENNDTTYIYKIYNYKHNFVQNFVVTKIADYSPNCQIISKSISPNRTMFFYVEYSSYPDNFTLKGIDLSNNQVRTIDDNFTPLYYYGVSDISAVSSEELVVKTKLSYYYPGSDTVDVCRYSISTNNFTRISYMSNSYSTFSAVVNNHILFGIPIGDLESGYIDYNLLNNQSSYFPSYNYGYDKRTDNIWYDNAYYDESQQKFIELPFDRNNFSVRSYNRESEFTITIYHTLTLYNNLKIFRGSQLLFEEALNFKKNIFLIDGLSPSENIVFVFIHFYEGNSGNGFYEVNISANTIKLVHNLYSCNGLYWINQNEFLALQSDGFYRYSISSD